LPNDTPPSDPLERQLRNALSGTYDVEGELPAGGMSRVFRATERALGRSVVIKVLPPDLAAGVNKDRFRREIQLAAQLQHPHIVPLLSAGEFDGLLYYTMPFIPGESLKGLIASRTHATVSDTIRVMRDVADALAHAHARGIVHRDIKPGNVLRVDAHALVTDFGVAKALSAALPGVSMTTSGMAVGTPAYMAPEQLAGDPATDHRADVYATGLLGYEMLTGASPFASNSPLETLASQLTRDPEPLNSRRPDVPLGLAALISRCLAKAPELRPQSAAQMVAELDALIVTSGDFVPRQLPPPRRRWVVPAMFGAALVLVAGWLIAPRPKSQPETAPPVATKPDPAPAPATMPLTHADSVAIARAVERKLAEVPRAAAPRKAESGNPAPNKPAAGEPAAGKAASGNAVPGKTAPGTAALPAGFGDSLRAAIMRSVLDSVAREQAASARIAPGRSIRSNSAVSTSADSVRGPRVNPLGSEAFAARAANLGPPRRVFVSIPRELRGSAGINLAGTVIMNTLRAALARDPRYRVIPADSVARALAVTRTTDSIAVQQQVELFASLSPIPTSDGSVIWQLTARDLSAHGAYALRLTSVTVPLDSLLLRSDSLISMTVKHFAEMDKAPRRAPRP